MKKGKTIKNPILYRVLKPAAVFLFRIAYRPKIYGKENIPKSGAVVLAGNHKKFWDCFMVMAGTGRCVHFLAKSELFGNFFTKWFFTTAGIIPVHRNRKDKAALDDAEVYLNNGCVIGIFPEGTTNKTTEPLLPFKFGAVKMAGDTDSPIVPFVIKGEYRLFRRGVEITFYPSVEIDGEKLADENDKLRNLVYSKL